MATFKERIRKAALSWLFDAANPREIYRHRIEHQTARPINEEVSMGDLLQLRSDSRKLYANLGPVKGAVNSKAMHAIGRSWLPKFEGEDEEWGAAATEWLLEKFYPIADIHGRDFQTALFLLSVSIDRDGDCGALLTEYETGFPAIQIVPAHAIGQRKAETNIDSGPYKGLSMFHGVITNAVGRAVAYNILGPDDKGTKDFQVSARDLALLMEPEWADQIRGFPAFVHAILDLKTLRTVQGYEKMASELASSIGLLEYNETGMPDFSDPAIALNGNAGTATGMTVEARDGGLIRYMKANSGAKLEAFKNDRPGDAWDRFMNRLLRNACSGANWPYELVWDISALGGANTRLILATAMHAVADRQELLRPFARRAVGYAISKAIKNGDLPPNDEWFKWCFTMPARMTSDYGRDGKSDREDYILGITNLGDILAEEGKSLDQHIAERAEENDKLREAGLPVPSDSQAQADKVIVKDGGLPPDKSGEEMSALTAKNAALEARLDQIQRAPKEDRPINVNVAPPSVTVNNQPPQVQVSAPVVHMEAAPAPSVTITQAAQSAPVVNFRAPDVTVNVPQQAAPTVTLEAAPAPVVNITNEVNVPPLNATLTVKRDYNGKMSGAEITNTDGN